MKNLIWYEDIFSHSAVCIFPAIKIDVSGSPANIYERLAKVVNPLMHNVPKCSDTLQKSCSKSCKIFNVCLTILLPIVGKCLIWYICRNPRYAFDNCSKSLLLLLPTYFRGISLLWPFYHSGWNILVFNLEQCDTKAKHRSLYLVCKIKQITATNLISMWLRNII